MTVASETTRTQYSGNGSTTVFAIGFTILDNSHLKVILTSSSSVDTVKTITTHYTISGSNVTMLTAPASGEKLTLVRNVTKKQEVDYIENDTFAAATHETALDKLTQMVQEVNEKADRAVKVPTSSTITSGEIPLASVAAGYVLKINAGATGIDTVNVPLLSLTPTDDNFIVGNGTAFVTESGATARTSMGVGTGDSPQFTAVNIGNASDTTVSRASAGDIAVEGNIVYRAGGTDVPVTDGGTGSSTASGARTNLGLGTMAVQDSGSVTITGGSVTGITDVAVADGGTGSSTASGARTNLGLAIGTDVQAYSAQLTGIATAWTTASTASEATLKFLEDADNGTNYVTLAPAASLSSNYALVLPSASDTLVGKATTDTLTNKTLTSPVLNGSLTGTGIVDEDDMVSDSATKVPTQQSVKAYVTASVSGSGITDIVQDTTPQLGGDLDANAKNVGFDTNTGITDDSGNEQLFFTKTASAVNYLNTTNSATGNAVAVAAKGDDTDISLSIAAKGAGSVNITGSALKIPTGTAPTTDATGEIALDTNGNNSTVTTGVIQGYDGTQNLYFFGATNYPTSDNDVMVYDSGSHSVLWEAQSGTGGGSGITDIVQDVSPQLGATLDANSFDIEFDTATGIRDDAHNEQLIFTKTASAVNYVGITNSATTAKPTITSAGDDTNVGLIIDSKGTGNIAIGTADSTITLAGTSIDIGAAIATTVNKVTFTAPASGSTLTVANGKTLTASNTLTFTGTDGSSIACGTGGTIAYTASPTLTTPTIGVATATSINKVAITAPATSATLTIADGKTLTASNTLTFTGTDSSSVAFGAGGTAAYTGNKLSVFAATTSAELAGVISDETGSGKVVFDTTPTLVTPVLGVATATSVNKVAITAPASSATLTIADGKTLTSSNTLTLAGTDASTITLGGGGTVLYQNVTPTGSLNLAKGADIASTGSMTWGTDGNFYHITGTTTITAFNSLTAGVQKIAEFDAALTLTHNATSLILPTAANITTAAGDCAIFVSEGSGNWRCVNYMRKDGTALSAGAAPSAAAQSDQETATSTTTYVSPGRQQFHPSAAKAWVMFTSVTTTAITVSYNITSLTDNGTGDTTITIATDFSGADYAVSFGMRDGFMYVNGTGNKAAGTCRVIQAGKSLPGTAGDFIDGNAVFFGDQA